MPSTVERLQREREGQAFAVLLVNLKERPEKVSGWVKANGVTPLFVLDRDGAVTAAFRVTATPTVVLIDRDGKMIARAVGPQAWTSGPARKLLDLLVAQP